MPQGGLPSRRVPATTPPRRAANALALLAGFVVALGAGLVAQADPARAFARPESLCAAQTMAQERAAGLPDHLLTAISLVESGRWSPDLKARIAWPWTVMAEGRGRVFPTKAQAIAEVRALQARGVRNIDVGCMQVNMHYHGDAFGSLEEALDPAANVAYAVTFLSKLREETGSWAKAVTAYHSKTPVYAQRYAKKIQEAWTEARDTATGRLELATLNQRVPLPQPEQPIFARRTTDDSFYAIQTSAERLARYKAHAARVSAMTIARARAVDASYARAMAAKRAERAEEQEAARAFADDWRAKALEAWRNRSGG